MTVFAVGESIKSEVSSSSRRRDGETGSAGASFASAFASVGVTDSARTVCSSDLGGRRKSSHLVLR